MLTDLQKRTCQAIVNIFETGRIHGDYGMVTVHPEDPGHLTYGRSQTTLASGNLASLIARYCAHSDARLASALAVYQTRLAVPDLSLDFDGDLHALLREAGQDPAMWEVQDAFFDDVYWLPAQRSAAQLDIASALGTATVYDSRVHGSWPPMRDRTIAAHGRPADIGENAWITHYIAVRRAWLAGHSNRLLRRTVYRMEALSALAAADDWDLTLPITVRGLRIDETALDPAVRVSAEVAETRLLMLRSPFMRGDDVKAVQRALAAAGVATDDDGIFGPATDHAVRAFQETHGLSVDGKVGSATRSALGID